MASSSKFKFSFDHTDSVTRVGSVSAEAANRSGGPIEHATLCAEVAKKREQKRFDVMESTPAKQDSRSRRQAQNRKSSRSTSAGRKAYTAAIRDVNVGVAVQLHSLERTDEELDKEIKQAEVKLKHLERHRGDFHH